MWQFVDLPFNRDAQEMAVACLHFTCPNTNRIAPTGVEMDVQGLRTHWRSTLTLNCPHCDDVHDVCVSEVYLAACIASLDPYGSLPGRRYPRPQHFSAHPMEPRGDIRVVELVGENTSLGGGYGGQTSE
jgi:hypothetical protein